MVQQFNYPSCAGGMIHACRWLPEGQPKAVVQIIHGIAEYGARYDHFARFLASQGILVTVQDHMGHGGSICDETPRAVIQGGWFDMVEDTYQLFRDTHKEYPDVPYFFFGHSMGSFVLRTILAKYPDSGIAGAVICGTGWMGKPIMVGGLAVASAVCKIKGAAHPSPLLKSVMFGGYNSRIENARTENDWLSTDPKVVDTYNADPNCGFMASAGLVRAMLTGLLYIHKPENLAAMDRSSLCISSQAAKILWAITARAWSWLRLNLSRQAWSEWIAGSTPVVATRSSTSAIKKRSIWTPTNGSSPF